MKVKYKTIVPVVLLLCFSLLMPACSRQDSEDRPRSSGATGPVIAKVGAKDIRSEELKKYLVSRPASRTGKVSEQAARKRLNELVTSEALYQEALRLDLDRNPEVQHGIRQIIIQKLLEEKVSKPVEEWQITEKELGEYYEAHKNEFSRPEQVRVADIFIALPADATPEQQTEKKQLAAEILQKAIGERDNRFAFSQLIHQYSDKPRQYHQGDTGFFDSQGKPADIDGSLVEAAFKLQRNGEIADKVIETRDGFHIIMLVGRRSAVKKKLKKLAPMLKRRMKREELTRRRKMFIEAARTKGNINIDEAAFSKIIKKMNKADNVDRAPSTMPPGLPGAGRGTR